jgi:NitT/TauT family transport system ATP-binding protein
LQHELLKIHSAYHATELFVTHDIEEALYLSDRVLVMAGQPARIARTIEVPFPRHARLEARSTQEFARLKSEIWSLLGIDHSAARESVTGVGEAHHP